MKKFLAFTILLLSNTIFGCGYSPYGEDIRFCLFKPSYFNFGEFYSFNYHANLWGFDYDDANRTKQYESNILDWYNHIGGKVSLESIVDFNLNLTVIDIHSQSENEFIKYLFTNNKKSEIQYLINAKKCEELNSWQESNPWEKEHVKIQEKNKNFYNLLVKTYNLEKNTYLKRKYAFQLIRAAYYLNDYKTISTTFETQFKNSTKDYLYYWSLFFNCFTKNDPSKWVDVANIMANCPEKTNACYYYFHSDFNLKQALTATSNPKDIANLYAFSSLQKVDKNLENLKNIFQNNPNSKLLDFLLLREINKIEDWVYTPYYSNYLPSVEIYNHFWNDSNDKVTTQTLRARSEKDRTYALQVLQFIDSINFNKINNKALWFSAQIQLLFITKNYNECLTKINTFQKLFPNEKIGKEHEKIKALCIVSNQESGKAIIPNQIKSVVLNNLKDNRFIFAIARELEFRGNITDAVALLSIIDTSTDYGYDSTDVEWQGNRLKTTSNLEVFYNYFDYLDYVYSANELQLIVNEIDQKMDSDFYKIIFKKLYKDKNYLIDLLGTKYIREDKLQKALVTFKTLNNTYWTNNYNAWERDKYDENFAFDQNPFYSLKYTTDFIPHTEKFIVNKLSVTEHLIQYLEKANNPSTKHPEYYYFLVANCYLNMTYEGNSWMMRRYFSSSNYYEGYENQSYIDEREYRLKLKAIQYYEQAYKAASSQKFKALSLRMMEYAQNKPKFTQLSHEFPQYYDDLSSCNSLNEYFKESFK
jgi:hypothetical protein